MRPLYPMYTAALSRGTVPHCGAMSPYRNGLKKGARALLRGSFATYIYVQVNAPHTLTERNPAMSYAYAFPDFPASGIPSDLQSSAWEDMSWKNDACPSFWPVVANAGGVRVCVWTDYPDPMHREDPTAARFGVCYVCPDSMCYGEAVHAETWTEAQAAIIHLLDNLDDRPASVLLYPSNA